MANMHFKTNLLPNSNLEYSLGSTDKKWKINAVGSVNGAKIFYGTCTTTASEVAKVVTCPEFTTNDLTTGAIIFVTFTNANSGAVGSITLNVNGTGAKNIKEWRNGTISNIPGVGYIGANQTLMFWYNGTYWCTQIDYDSNDVNRSTISYPRLQTGSVGIGRYTLFMEASDGTYQSLTSTFNNTGTSHVKNTTKFKLGRIYYSNRSTDIAANDVADTTNSWQDQQTNLIDIRYSTNCGTTLIARQPLFIVGKVGPDGYFTLNDTWWTQTVPTTEDGNMYIYIGIVYNDTSPYRVTFEIENPVYWYKNNGFRLYGSGRGIAEITRSGTTFTITRDDSSTITIDQQDTWILNSAASNGYVLAGSGHANKVWKTDDQGNPDWRDDNNTDTKQDIIVNTTTKAYITGVTTATSSVQSLTGIADTNVYLTDTAGGVSAGKYYLNSNNTDKAYITFNTTTNAIDFVFV